MLILNRAALKRASGNQSVRIPLGRLIIWTLVLLTAAAGLALSAEGVFYLYAKQQVVPSSHWKTFKTAKVVFDQKGIPTLTANHWHNFIEAQGYVVASERMWQMDLMRRKASGRLAEWFGSKALAIDSRRRVEDWPGVLESASTSLPEDERLVCDAYAKGVNRFMGTLKDSVFQRALWIVGETLIRSC